MPFPHGFPFILFIYELVDLLLFYKTGLILWYLKKEKKKIYICKVTFSLLKLSKQYILFTVSLSDCHRGCAGNISNVNFKRWGPVWACPITSPNNRDFSLE